MRSAGLALLALGVFGFSVLLLSPLFNRVSEDESTYVYDAHRLAVGRLPYRDFFTFSPPGVYYLLAGAASATGLGPETAERWAVLAAVVASWLAFAWASSARGRSFQLAAMSALFPLGLYPFAPFSSPHQCLALSFLVGTAALLPWVWNEKPKVAALFVAGFLAGASGMFVQTDGAIGLVMAVFGGLAGSRTIRDAVRRMLWSLGGAGCAVALCLAPIAAGGGLAAFWQDAVIWPFTHYKQPGNINDLPMLFDLVQTVHGIWSPPEPSGNLNRFLEAACGSVLFAAVVAGTAAALGCSLFALGKSALERRRLHPSAFTAAVLTPFALGFYILGTPTWVHLLFLATPVLCLWILAYEHYLSGNRRAKRWALVAVLFFLAAGILYHGRTALYRLPKGWELWDVDRVDRESPLNQSLRASPLLKPGDTIVVLPTGGNVYLYTYPAAIGYTYLFPLEDGYHGLDDHIRAAAEIEKKRPKLILIHKIRLKAFLGDGGPLARVIRRDYSPSPGSPAIALFVRNGT